jgi:hypothetical protein
MVELSRELERTLHNAITNATEHKHEYATIEHLLLALCDDSTVKRMLLGCNVDVEALRRSLGKYIDLELLTLVIEDEEEAKPTTGFQRIVQRAILHVQNAGRKTVTGQDALIALFTERESHAVYFLQEQNFTRLDAVSWANGVYKRSAKSEISEIKQRTEASRSGVAKADTVVAEATFSASGAPQFRATRNGVRYRPAEARGEFAERKAIVTERCDDVRAMCGRRANEQPRLHNILNQYSVALKALSRKKGAYRLLLAGLSIESLLRAKASSIPDPDRNPALDADLLHGIETLIVAHAGLMALFPDVQKNVNELDSYREHSQAIDALRHRILDPVLEQLTARRFLLEPDTLELTREIAAAGNADSDSGIVSRREAATKHSWLRGLLATIGTYVAKKIRFVLSKSGEVVVQEGIEFALKHSDKVLAAALVFFATARESLMALAHSLASSFGWLESLLALLK